MSRKEYLGIKDLMERMEIKGRCMEWQGAVSKAGYGIVTIGGRVRRVHRVMWEMHKGAIGAGMHVHHVCGNRRCANIEHLAVVSPGEHVELSPRHEAWRRGLALYCQRGHAFTSENTIRGADGHRHCRSCKERRRKGPAIERPLSHCKWGHPFTRANTYIRPDTGIRTCRICRSLHLKTWVRRHPEKYRALKGAQKARARLRNPEKYRAQKRAKYLRRKLRLSPAAKGLRPLLAGAVFPASLT